MGQYFSNESLPSKMEEYTTIVLGTQFRFMTDNGVFCKDYLDFGTRLLLEHLPYQELGDSILDVGCGYGPIGIIVASLSGARVDMVDVNRRALHLSEINAKKNNVGDQVRIYESNCYENVNKSYHSIITNPPIRAGKNVVYEIVLRAREHLEPGGALYLVVRKDQGAKSLMNELEKVYQLDVLERKKGFFILRCKI